MRLLNARTFAIHECLGDHTEEYAILSHTWGEEECTFQDVSARRFGQKGFSKIKFCCEQAVKDGLDWVWVDT
jgi:hypothetical protein